jgi:hypothetical protein
MSFQKKTERHNMSFPETIIKQTNLINVKASKHYIETLYLSTSLHDHIEGDYLEEDKHNLVLSKLYKFIVDSGAKYLGTSQGREWYQFKKYRLGIVADFEKIKKANWYSLVVQYNQKYLFELEDIESLKLPIGKDKEKYKITRVDISTIYKSDIDYLQEDYEVISRYRKEGILKQDGKILTRYYGSRKSGNMVRWYNKTRELTDTSNYSKIDLLSKYFGDIKNLYTIELELHRKYLKEIMGIENLTQINKIYDAYKDIVGSMRIYKNIEENRKHIANKNYERIEAYQFVVYSKYDRVQRERKETSITYFIEEFERKYQRLKEAVTITTSQKMRIIEYFANVLYEDKHIRVSIDFYDIEEIEKDIKDCEADYWYRFAEKHNIF